MRTTEEMEEVLQALFCMGEDAATAGAGGASARGAVESARHATRGGAADAAGAGPFAEDEVLRRAGVSAEVLGQAVEAGLVVKGAGGLALSESGAAEARDVVRRHRLAERLLHDVLQVADAASESAACRFEHVLQGEVTESICALLGHPRACPHGKRIPPGACCTNGNRHVPAVIQKLSELRVGDCGAVAYIHTASAERLNRLSSFGLVPGSVVRMHQRWPSIVIEVGETQLALDRETAEDVFVRKGAAEDRVPKKERRRRRGFWKKG